MLFLQAALAAFLVVGVSAFRLPGNLEDGRYGVYVDEHGQEVHMRLTSEGSSVVHVARHAEADHQSIIENPLEKRSEVGIWCGCGIELNHGDCDAAVNALSDELATNPGTDPFLSHYLIRGSVVAFLCADCCGPVSIQVQPWELHDALARVTQDCGWYIAGTYRMFKSYEQTLDWASLGYMRYFEGLDFCGAALGSSQHSC